MVVVVVVVVVVMVVRLGLERLLTTAVISLTVKNTDKKHFHLS